MQFDSTEGLSLSVESFFVVEPVCSAAQRRLGPTRLARPRNDPVPGSSSHRTPQERHSQVSRCIDARNILSISYEPQKGHWR